MKNGILSRALRRNMTLNKPPFWLRVYHKEMCDTIRKNQMGTAKRRIVGHGLTEGLFINWNMGCFAFYQQIGSSVSVKHNQIRSFRQVIVFQRFFQRKKPPGVTQMMN